jgi:hypothetical protein
MSRRLEIELTSSRPDGTWTWRAAGAKQPKGDLDGAILPEGTDVGAVLRVDADFMVDGIEITGVVPDKAPRKTPELLEILGSGKVEPLVTTQLAPKGRGRPKGDRKRRDGRGQERDRDDRPRGPRPDPVPERPAPKRLRPRRTHRDAALAEVPDELRPIAEQVLQGGVPAVRDSVRKQNEAAKKENRPEIPMDQVVAMAEKLLPKLRSAEWLDRAETAKADLDVLDLRDLRSVVVAADGAAKSEEARALRDELTAGLLRRVDEEHRLWISDMEANLNAGRFVRTLRLSSRPPKAGTPLPPDLAKHLIEAVSAGLNARTKQELYAAALDALSFSPVHAKVTPAGKPENPSEDLLEAARRIADKAPAVAVLFGVEPSEANAARKRRKRTRRDSKDAQGGKAPKSAKGLQGGKGPKGGGPREGAKGGSEEASSGADPDESQIAETPEVVEARVDTPAPAEDAPAPEPVEDGISGEAES